MRIRDEEAMERHRGPGHCLRCDKHRIVRHPHHCFITRGAGGPDVDENLAPLCPVCHSIVHANVRAWREVEQLVAEREGLTVDNIREWLWAVIREPKGGTMPPRPWRNIVYELLGDMVLWMMEHGPAELLIETVDSGPFRQTHKRMRMTAHKAGVKFYSVTLLHNDHVLAARHPSSVANAEAVRLWDEIKKTMEKDNAEEGRTGEGVHGEGAGRGDDVRAPGP